MDIQEHRDETVQEQEKHKPAGWIVKQINIAGIVMYIPLRAETQKSNVTNRLADARRSKYWKRVSKTRSGTDGNHMHVQAIGEQNKEQPQNPMELWYSTQAQQELS